MVKLTKLFDKVTCSQSLVAFSLRKTIMDLCGKGRLSRF